MTNGLLPFAQDVVRELLQRPHDRAWTIQGLGMLRCYFGHTRTYRLHLWSRQFITPGVSAVHSHPWDFTSHVIAGRFTNVRFGICEHPFEALSTRTHYAQTVKCGEGGGLVGEPTPVRLFAEQPECYQAGDTYTQRAEEIHESHFAGGTVTLCQRTVREGDGNHARVFWRIGEEFVTAEPRAATPEQIEAACSHSLAAWF